jgi:competence protein ComGF
MGNIFYVTNHACALHTRRAFSDINYMINLGVIRSIASAFSILRFKRKDGVKSKDLAD